MHSADIDDGAREVLVFQLEDVGDLGDYVLGTDISATITIKEGICDRADAVKQAILAGLATASDQCAKVTDAELLDGI